MVGASIARPDEIRLSTIGEVVDEAICGIPNHYSQVTVDHYVIMPNHIHLIINIKDYKNALEFYNEAHKLAQDNLAPENIRKIEMRINDIKKVNNER